VYPAGVKDKPAQATGTAGGRRFLAPQEANMPEQSVVGVYETLAKAEQAVRELDRQGFP
jgi:hypothetical protein